MDVRIAATALKLVLLGVSPAKAAYEKLRVIDEEQGLCRQD